MAILVAMNATRAGASPPPIVLIVVDTLRADHLDNYGYFRNTSPNLTAFARDSLLFERAMTPSGVTLPAHVSLFSSTNPPRHGVHGNFDHFHTPVPNAEFRLMAQILARLGYRTAGFVSSTAVAAETGIAAGFDVYGESGDRQGGRRAADTTDEVLKWLGEIDSAEPFFLFVHYADPHSPYAPPPPYDKMFSTDDSQRAFFERLGVPAAGIYIDSNNLYDGEVCYADTQIGRLFDALEQRGVYERAAIIFTADHGEGLGQHNWLYHSRVYEEQMHVPLLVRLPQRDDLHGVRRGDVVSLIDVLPTLGANLGLAFTPEETAQFEGIDVLGPIHREYAFGERNGGMQQDRERDDYHVLAGRQWKFFLRGAGRDQLFDLSVDPGELHNLIAAQPQIAESMRSVLQRQLDAYRGDGAAVKKKEEIPASTRERLHQLGYE